MVKKTLDDLRAIIDPEGYLAGLREVAANYKQRLAQLLVDYDLMADSPEIPEQQRPAILKQQLTVMRDVDWRMTAIDERIEAAANGMAPNRAAKRRAARAKKKS